MTISDLCVRKLVTIDKAATLSQAAKLMRDNHVGDVVVIETNGSRKPVGILTDRDIVLNVLADDRQFSSKVGEVMSTNVVCVQKDDSVSDAVDSMEAAAVRRLIVINEDGSVFGLVSSDDILRMVAKEMNGLGRMIDRQMYKEAMREEPTRRNVMT